MSQSSDITLDDVDTAVKILEAFLSRMQKAQLVIRKVQAAYGLASQGRPMSGGMPSWEEITRMVTKMKMEEKEEAEGGKAEPDLTPEEIDKMKRLVAKYKSAEQTKPA